MSKSGKRIYSVAIIILIVVVFSYISVGTVLAKDSAPGDFFYPVDVALEDIELLIAGDEKDVELYEEQIEERVKEIEKLSEKDENGDSEENIDSAYELFEEKLNALNELLDNLCDEGDTECEEKLVEKVTNVGENTLKHIEVLSDVYVKLVEKGNENAAESVLFAMEKSMNGHERAIQALSKSKGNDKKNDGEQDEALDAEESVIDDLEKKFKDKKENALEKINLAKERLNGKDKN